MSQFSAMGNLQVRSSESYASVDSNGELLSQSNGRASGDHLGAGGGARNGRAGGNRAVDAQAQERGLKGLKSKVKTVTTAKWAQAGALVSVGAIGATLGLTSTSTVGMWVGAAAGVLGGPVGVIAGAAIGALVPPAIGAIVGYCRGRSQAKNLSRESVLHDYKPGSDRFNDTVRAYNGKQVAKIAKSFNDVEKKQIENKFEAFVDACFRSDQPLSSELLDKALAGIVARQADLRTFPSYQQHQDRVQDAQARIQQNQAHSLLQPSGGVEPYDDDQPVLTLASHSGPVFHEIDHESTGRAGRLASQDDAGPTFGELNDEVTAHVSQLLEIRVQANEQAKAMAIARAGADPEARAKAEAHVEKPVNAAVIDQACRNVHMINDPSIAPHLRQALREIVGGALEAGSPVSETSMNWYLNTLERVENGRGMSRSKKDLMISSLTREFRRMADPRDPYMASPEQINTMVRGLRHVFGEGAPREAGGADARIVDLYLATLRETHVAGVALHASNGPHVEDGEEIARGFKMILASNKLDDEGKKVAAEGLVSAIQDEVVLRKPVTWQFGTVAARKLIRAETLLSDKQKQLNELDKEAVATTFRRLVVDQVRTGQDQDLAALLDDVALEMGQPTNFTDQQVAQLRTNAQETARELARTLAHNRFANSDPVPILRCVEKALKASRRHLVACTMSGIRQDGSIALKKEYQLKPAEYLQQFGERLPNDLKTNPAYRQRGGHLTEEDYSSAFGARFHEALDAIGIKDNEAREIYEQQTAPFGPVRTIAFAQDAILQDPRVEIDRHETISQTLAVLGDTGGVGHAMHVLLKHSVGSKPGHPVDQEIEQKATREAGKKLTGWEREAYNNYNTYGRMQTVARESMPRTRVASGRVYNEKMKAAMKRLKDQRDPEYLAASRYRMDMRTLAVDKKVAGAVKVDNEKVVACKDTILQALPSMRVRIDALNHTMKKEQVEAGHVPKVKMRDYKPRSPQPSRANSDVDSQEQAGLYYDANPKHNFVDVQTGKDAIDKLLFGGGTPNVTPTDIKDIYNLQQAAENQQNTALGRELIGQAYELALQVVNKARGGSKDAPPIQQVAQEQGNEIHAKGDNEQQVAVIYKPVPGYQFSDVKTGIELLEKYMYDHMDPAIDKAVKQKIDDLQSAAKKAQTPHDGLELLQEAFTTAQDAFLKMGQQNQDNEPEQVENDGSSVDTDDNDDIVMADMEATPGGPNDVAADLHKYTSPLNQRK